MQPTPQLKPLRIADLLDTAIRLYRANFVLFAGIVAVLLVPLTLVQLAALAYYGSANLVELLQNLVFVNLASATLATAIARIYLGQPISIGEAYRASRGRFWAVIAATIAQGLIMGMPLLIIGFCSIGLMFRGSLSPEPWLIAVPLLLTLAPILLLYMRFVVATPAIMLENIDATAGLKRSWQLTRGSFWRVFGIMLAVGILSVLLAQLPAIALAYLLALAGSPLDMQMQQSFATVLSQLGLILAMPIQLASQTLLYYDLRVRHEAYDLELLAQQATAP